MQKKNGTLLSGHAEKDAAAPTDFMIPNDHLIVDSTKETNSPLILRVKNYHIDLRETKIASIETTKLTNSWGD